MRFADELLEDGSTEVSELDLGFTVGEVSSASWLTAERTGAIAHMDYERVRELARVYEAQDLFVAHQRQNLDRLTSAIAVISGGGDPTKANERDLLAFRDQVTALRAALFIEAQLAERARELYDAVLSDSATGTR